MKSSKNFMVLNSIFFSFFCCCRQLPYIMQICVLFLFRLVDDLVLSISSISHEATKSIFNCIYKQTAHHQMLERTHAKRFKNERKKTNQQTRKQWTNKNKRNTQTLHEICWKTPLRKTTKDNERTTTTSNNVVLI